MCCLFFSKASEMLSVRSAEWCLWVLLDDDKLCFGAECASCKWRIDIIPNTKYAAPKIWLTFALVITLPGAVFFVKWNKSFDGKCGGRCNYLHRVPLLDKNSTFYCFHVQINRYVDRNESKFQKIKVMNIKWSDIVDIYKIRIRGL